MALVPDSFQIYLRRSVCKALYRDTCSRYVSVRSGAHEVPAPVGKNPMKVTETFSLWNPKTQTTEIYYSREEFYRAYPRKPMSAEDREVLCMLAAALDLPAPD